MAKTKVTKKLFIPVLVALALFAGLLFGSILSSNAGEYSDNTKVQDYEKQINALKDQASAIKKRLSSTKSDIKASEQELADLSDLEAITNERLKLSQDLIDELETSKKELTEAIAEKEEFLDTTFEKFLQRTRASYEDGTASYLELLFSSSSISDLLSKWDYISAILSNDKKLMADYRAQKASLEDERQSLEVAINQQKTLSDSLDDLRAELGILKQNAEQALEDLRLLYRVQSGEYNQIDEQLDEVNKELEKYLEMLAQQSQGQYSGEGMIWPVLPIYRSISSNFGWRTYMYKGSKITDYHTGIDISASGINGSSILAVASGTVIKAELHSSYGNYVIIDHGGGICTLYAHSSKLLVKVGQKVAQGDIIAKVGTTGQSTGPHLHFEVRVNGKAVDPIKEGYVVQPPKNLS